MRGVVESGRRAGAQPTWPGLVVRGSFVLAAAGALVVSIPPEWVDRVYSRHVYAVLQPRLTSFSNLIPWAVTDLVVACWLAWIGWWGWRCASALRPRPSLRGIVRQLAGLAVAASVLCLWFLLAWGFNYRKGPLTDRIDYSARRVTTGAAVALAERAAVELNTLHAPAHRVGWPDWEPMASQMSDAAAHVWANLGVPARFRPGRPKRSLATACLGLAGISGFTSPFVLEIVPDWYVPAVVRSDVLAHEWAHLAGFADEAEAGYIGWLTGLSGPVWAQYSAWLALFPRLAAGLPEADRRRIMATIADGPRRDWRAIARYRQREIDAMREASWRVYDRFLKANRVEAGVASYDGVVRLVLGTRYGEGSWRPAERR